jgi:hypothetical protein
MIRAVDPSFSFDNVARRVARQRLVRLLHALFRLADPDNPHAIRASSGEPPARWLSRLVQLGMVEDAALIDPWGRPFVFRRLPPGRRAVVVVSERAVDFELVSPGPDGISGNGDDVRDPFQRVVPRHTPYAVASGEDALMQRLSRIAPGNNVLQSMVQAYRRQSLAVLEESRRGPVEATGSEDMDDMGPGDLAESDAIMAEEEQAGEALGGMSLEGRGYGAGGGRAGPRRSRSRRAEATASLSPDEPAPAPPPAPTKSLRPQSPLAAPAATIPRAMGELVRERFPATLFFLAETPLNAQGQTLVDVPLADALTTYRLEAIAWTASGWTTSAMGRLRVDQEAMVDAPVPAVATRGDNLRLPVRVANRTANALATRIEVEVEGDLSLSVPEPFRLVVPPGEAREHIVEVQPGTVGQGTLLVRLVRDEDGRSLDAVRRPLTVQENVRLARESREELIVAGQTLRVHVPDEATPRGPGELRLALGSGLFGDPARWALDRGREGTLWGGWALSVSNRPLPEEMTTALLTNLSHDEDEWYGEPVELALVVANLWTNQQLSDDMVRLGLRAMSELLVAEGEESVEAGDDEALWLLLALAPVVRQAERRPALRGDVADLVGGLGRMISSQAAQAAEAPAQWARAAAALALGRGGEVDARAREMVRRASRHVIEVGDEAWLEPSTTDGTVLPRLEPTSLLALARLALGDSPAEVLPLLRSLARVLRGVEEWPVRSRALASAAAAALTGSAAPPDRLTILLDGQRLDVERDEGVLRAVLPGIGRPGEHEIDLRLGSGQVALAWLDVRYGLPWHVRPRRQAAVDLQWTGQAGVRDGRAGLRLEIRNRGARILTRPVVEVELPAGSELDEGTRQSLESLLAEPATMEGRTLRLRLRPLAPGGYLRLPLPLRWAVGGTIMGLGTTLWDDAGPSSLAERPAQILPSRGVEIADRGSEPPLQEAESSPPFFGPEPRPPLLLAPLAPIAEVLQ